MFSVIIPLYNKASYILKAVDSVLNQTYQDFELIVVNDGSTDDGPEKIEKFKVQSSKFKIISQHNSGVSIARNDGVKSAKYDYVTFLDADDWWEPTFLEEMKSLIDDYPEAGIYGSNYNIVKNGRKQLATVGIEPDFRKGLINYCKVYSKTLCMPLTSITTVIRKDIFEYYNGFKSGLKLGEDFDLWIRVALKYPVAFINRPLANYNQDVELSGRIVGNIIEPKNHVLWNLDYLAEEERNNPDLKQLLDNLRVYVIFPYYLSAKHYEKARQELEKVDWSKQPSSVKRKYNTPVYLLNIKQKLLHFGSCIKQTAIKYNVHSRL